jgi:hypothetical protein
MFATLLDDPLVQCRKIRINDQTGDIEFRNFLSSVSCRSFANTLQIIQRYQRFVIVPDELIAHHQQTMQYDACSKLSFIIQLVSDVISLIDRWSNIKELVTSEFRIHIKQLYLHLFTTRYILMQQCSKEKDKLLLEFRTICRGIVESVDQTYQRMNLQIWSAYIDCEVAAGEQTEAIKVHIILSFLNSYLFSK